MNISIEKLIVIVLLSVGCNKALYSQWLSVEGDIGIGHQKTIYDNLNFPFADIESDYFLNDTTYIVKRGDMEVLNQKIIYSSYAANIILNYNQPIKERLTVSIGTGFNLRYFSYRDVMEVESFETASTEYLEEKPLPDAYPVGPIQVDGSTSIASISTSGLSSGLPCDSVTSIFAFEGGEFLSTDGRLPAHHNFTNLRIPISFHYALKPDVLNIKGGVGLDFQLAKFSSYSKPIVFTNTFLSNDSLHVCSIFPRQYISEGNNGLATILSDAFIRVEAKVLPRIWVYVNCSQTLQSITKPEETVNETYHLNIPFKYRPRYLRLGISIDLIRKKKLQKRKSNYLIKSQVEL